jgi:hypothetical protein
MITADKRLELARWLRDMKDHGKTRDPHTAGGCYRRMQ